MARQNNIAIVFLITIALFLFFAPYSTTASLNDDNNDDETGQLHILPVNVHDGHITLMGHVACPTGCEGGDIITFNIAQGDNTISYSKTNTTLIDREKKTFLENVLTTNGDNTKSVQFSITVPAGAAKTSEIAFTSHVVLVKNGDVKDKKYKFLPLQYSADVEVVLAKGEQKQILRSKFTVQSDPLFAVRNTAPTDPLFTSNDDNNNNNANNNKNKENSNGYNNNYQFIATMVAKDAPNLPRNLNIVAEDIAASVDKLYVSLYGQYEINVEQFKATTISLNGNDMNGFVSIINSAIDQPFGDSIPTIVIDVKGALTKPLPQNSNLSLEIVFPTDGFVLLDQRLLTYVSVSALKTPPPPKKDDKDEVKATYLAMNGPIYPIALVNPPTLTSTSIADGNYIYQQINISYNLPTSIKEMGYGLTIRGVKPQFAYIYLSNSTEVQTHDEPPQVGFLRSTLQIDKIWFNAQTIKTSIHEFEPMFESNEFVSKTYSILVVAPAAVDFDDGFLTTQFTLFHEIPQTDTTPASYVPIVTIAAPIQEFRPLVTYPQFDVQTVEKDKVDNKHSQDVANVQVYTQSTSTLAQDVLMTTQNAVLTKEEQEWYGARDITSPLEFSVDFRKLLVNVTTVTLHFPNQQFLFTGEFTTGCTINNVEITDVVATPLITSPQYFTTLVFKHTLPWKTNMILTCKKGFIVHRETYQTDDILNSYFPLRVFTEDSKSVAGSTVMFHYPNHSIKNDFIFIFACVITGVLFIPLSQLFLCWVHPSKPVQVDEDENLINTGLLAVQDEPEEEASGPLGNDKFTRPMHSVHRRLNLVTQSEDPHH